MKTADFDYTLPSVLIAQHPGQKRTDSRLLRYHRGDDRIRHQRFADFPHCLRPGDCLVFNDTRVIPARLYGHKETGGKVEILLERLLDARHALAHVRASKAPRAGSRIFLDTPEAGHADICLRVEGRDDALFRLASEGATLADIMQAHGHMPLPPYIARADENADRERYQTVYASQPGAVAAPTAGLHFDEAMLAELETRGIHSAYVTLHVGAGTFQPVRSETVEAHRMHREWLRVPEETVALCRQTRAGGGRIVAVGTTAVRALETASASGALQPFEGDTDIFIYPGYRFRSVDALLTNFHLPQSTLLMLVSAFAGIDAIRRCYQAAIEEKYRFFSYGDAMFIE